MEKVVCAAANCKNGAYIVCGVDEKNMKVVGEPISEGHKDFYDDRVREAKNNLKSVKSDKITITVKLIPVLENPNLKYSSINAGRFVIVINVSPCLRNTYYLKHDEGYKSYEFTDKRVEEIGVKRLY